MAKNIKELAQEYLKLYPMDVLKDMLLTTKFVNKVGDARIELFAHWANDKIKELNNANFK